MYTPALLALAHHSFDVAFQKRHEAESLRYQELPSVSFCRTFLGALTRAGEKNQLSLGCLGCVRQRLLTKEILKISWARALVYHQGMLLHCLGDAPDLSLGLYLRQDKSVQCGVKGWTARDAA